MTIKSLNAMKEIEYHENIISFSFDQQDLLTNRIVYSTKFPEQFQFDGILGNDFLSEFDMVLNFPSSFVLLKKNHSIQFEELGFQGIETDFPMGYIVVDGFINGATVKNFFLDNRCFGKSKKTPFTNVEKSSESDLCNSGINSSFPKKFMLDTGSGLSYISLGEDEKKQFLAGEKTLYFDALGKIQEGDVRIAEKVCFITQLYCQEDAEFLTGKNSFQLNLQKNGNLFGLIGMNWLKDKEIVISHSKKKIYFRNK